MAKEHPFEVWVAYFDALKATKLGPCELSSPGTLGSWDAADIPTLESMS
jgi:hypothetical protein